MSRIGNVESLWRYPVKSMRGEELQAAFLGYAGVYGDRLYAFHSSAAKKGFPYLTGREQNEMILYRPRYRYPEQAAQPPNLADAEASPPGATPLYPPASGFALDVETPSGTTLPIEDPALLELLRGGIRERHELTLLRSERAMTDCRPVSLFSIQTAQQLTAELGTDIGTRRFRANIYLNLSAAGGFAEDEFLGRKLQIGSKAVVSILERDPRCKMITLDPDTAQANPEIMKQVAKAHGGRAGVYAAVLVEGMIRHGDEVTVC